jgi:hypothetical protein
MEILLSVAIGVSLAAAVGFRVFVPFTVMSVAALSGHLDLAPGFEWIGTYPAFITFSVATILEIMAYYVPWVDNLLDTIATPVAVVAGAVVTASVLGDVSPFLRWSMAVIAGGGIAATVQSATTFLRGVSSLTTGGLGNGVVSTTEWVSSLITAIFAVLLPLAAIVFVLVFAVWWLRHRSRRNRVQEGTLVSSRR